MTTVPLVDLEALHCPYASELHAALDRVLSASSFTGGAEVEAFEHELADRIGVAHAVGVASGTAALTLTLIAAGVGVGDEVILPPNTFIATAEAVVACGATPVLADVDPRTALLDPVAVEDAITPRTVAVIPVHLYGQPVDADRFAALANRRGLFFLEDSCQAMGAAWDGRPAGALGDAAAFSFYPSKNVGALGDGGAVTTSNAALARRVRVLRSHGEAEKHQHEVWGSCERLDGLQAAFLRVKLARLEETHELRRASVDRYRRALAAVPHVELLVTSPRAEHGHHLMVVRVPERDAVLEGLRARGIGAAVHYPTPIHLQPVSIGLGKRGQFPGAEALADSVLSLPLWPGMGDHVVDRIVDTLRDVLQREMT